MALLNLPDPIETGDIVPVVKYDARAGRTFRVDRVDGANVSEDITAGFKAVFDFENAEVGFINFNTGSAPDFCMVPFGAPMPPCPSQLHKPGVRLLVKLAKQCGGDVREFAFTSRACINGINGLHTEYEAQKAANPGKLPVVTIATTVAVTSGSGAQKSTNYQPHFRIDGWAPRPVDLVAHPRGLGVHTPGASAPPPGALTPPSTGSTRVGPPITASAAPAAPPPVEDDFG